MSKDPMGERMKSYESQQDYTIDLSKPTVVRLDGKGFSKFTKGMQKPFELRLIQVMESVAHDLMKFFQAELIYTQSDEITVVLKKIPSALDIESGAEPQTPFFNGRIQKILTLMSSYTTARFNLYFSQAFPERSDQVGTAIFDARIFSLPDEYELINAILWRARDCEKNAKTLFARKFYSHNEIQGIRGDDLISSIKNEFGADYYEVMPDFFKYGLTVLKVLEHFDDGEISYQRTKPHSFEFKHRFNPDLIKVIYGQLTLQEIEEIIK